MKFCQIQKACDYFATQSFTKVPNLTIIQNINSF
eukprot:UN21936